MGRVPVLVNCSLMLVRKPAGGKLTIVCLLTPREAKLDALINGNIGVRKKRTLKLLPDDFLST